MSGDEIVVFLATVILSLVFWIPWTLENLRVGHHRAGRGWLNAAPLASGAALCAVLLGFASYDVQDDPVYVVFYMSMGAAWVGLAVRVVLPYLGLSARDDVLERGNVAAAYAMGGAVLGLTLCFAGGNIGDGPGWWVVVFSALLSTGAFFISWFFLDKLTRLADVVTIDRDPAAGLRLAAFFAGSGLILGRAVAGNWTWLGAISHRLQPLAGRRVGRAIRQPLDGLSARLPVGGVLEIASPRAPFVAEPGDVVVVGSRARFTSIQRRGPFAGKVRR